jgi:hypothetical protein
MRVSIGSQHLEAYTRHMHQTSTSEEPHGNDVVEPLAATEWRA